MEIFAFWKIIIEAFPWLWVCLVKLGMIFYEQLKVFDLFCFFFIFLLALIFG